MNRRDLLATSLAAPLVAGVLGEAARAAGGDLGGREYYELRVYHFKDEAKLQAMESFIQRALVPAGKRMGLRPYGIFTPVQQTPSPTLYALVTYKSPEDIESVKARLAADTQFRADAAEYFRQPFNDPLFTRMESSLMVAFQGMPSLEVPPLTNAIKPRLYELRTYESHSDLAHETKMRMFNEGEIAIFRRCGLNPVFFGSTLIGERLPNLTYMLAFDDMEAHDKAWRTFGGDPEWKTLSTTPGYTDREIVSKISNWFLKPTNYSPL
ncbi:MAG TPA: NIPSNAP family protein [Armatimonadota bacterium]|jgi:hypothetical protein